LSNSGWSKLR